MKAMLTTKIIILSARPKLSWGGGLLSNSPQVSGSQNALNLLERFLSRFSSSFAGSSWIPRGHLQSSAAPLLRGGRTRAHWRCTRGALISSLWRSSVHLAAFEVSLKFICYQTCNTFLDCKLYRNWAILHFMHSFPPVVHSTLKCVVYIWAHMPPK